MEDDPLIAAANAIAARDLDQEYAYRHGPINLRWVGNAFTTWYRSR